MRGARSIVAFLHIDMGAVEIAAVPYNAHVLSSRARTRGGRWRYRMYIYARFSTNVRHATRSIYTLNSDRPLCLWIQRYSDGCSISILCAFWNLTRTFTDFFFFFFFFFFFLHCRFTRVYFIIWSLGLAGHYNTLSFIIILSLSLFLSQQSQHLTWKSTVYASRWHRVLYSLLFNEGRKGINAEGIYLTSCLTCHASYWLHTCELKCTQHPYIYI